MELALRQFVPRAVLHLFQLNEFQIAVLHLFLLNELRIVLVIEQLGDPMSSLLFNTVLQYALKNVFSEMAKKKGNGNLLERPRTRLPDELAIR